MGSYQEMTKIEYVRLNCGVRMPNLGLGCGYLQTTDADKLEAILDRALELGYRHFDTAYVYRNEHILGSVFKKWIDSGRIKREDLFVTSKLPPHGNHPDKVNLFLRASLAALQMEYIDLYLIHSPTGYHCTGDHDFRPHIRQEVVPVVDVNTDLEGIWKEMEVQQKLGLARAIGVSNFNTRQLRRIIKMTQIIPDNIQVELHAHFQRPELRDLCNEHNIFITAYGTLGSLRREELMKEKGKIFKSPPLLQDPVVINLSKKYGKSPAQILMRHLIQLKVTPVVTTSNLDRLSENLKVFDFTLDQVDMERMKALDKGAEGRSFTATTLTTGAENHPEFPHRDP